MFIEFVIELMGVVVEEVQASIQGIKLKLDGFLLIIYWGMSGLAIFKFLVFGVCVLSELGYVFKVQVNWANQQNVEQVLDDLWGIMAVYFKKDLSNECFYVLFKCLWSYLLDKVELVEDKKWGEIGKKGLYKFIYFFINDVYQVQGKIIFKEEFVICGGVSF